MGAAPGGCPAPRAAPRDAPAPAWLSVHRFPVTVAPGTKLESGPATLHLCNDVLVVARDVPPAVSGQWKLSDLRRYGAVPNGFIFEGGTRCGYCEYPASGPLAHAAWGHSAWGQSAWGQSAWAHGEGPQRGVHAAISGRCGGLGRWGVRGPPHEGPSHGQCGVAMGLSPVHRSPQGVHVSGSPWDPEGPSPLRTEEPTPVCPGLGPAASR